RPRTSPRWRRRASCPRRSPCGSGRRRSTPRHPRPSRTWPSSGHLPFDVAPAEADLLVAALGDAVGGQSSDALDAEPVRAARTVHDDVDRGLRGPVAELHLEAGRPVAPQRDVEAQNDVPVPVSVAAAAAARQAVRVAPSVLDLPSLHLLGFSLGDRDPLGRLVVAQPAVPALDERPGVAEGRLPDLYAGAVTEQPARQ